MTAFSASAIHKAILVAVAAGLTYLLLTRLVTYSPIYETPQWGKGHYFKELVAEESHVRNRTLGFEKVFALNLPERSDKRDALALASSLTHFQIEFIDGVKGVDLVNKSLPFGQEDRHMKDPMLGSWRAHMNAIRTVVEQGLSSALILEDDADWDIRIKDQLESFAEGSKWRQGYTVDNITHSPYGDDWDVLWIGHCHDIFKEKEGQPYAYHDDTTVAPKMLHINRDMKDWLGNWPDHTRLVQYADWPICSYAYAVSYRGAQKLLWELSVKHLRMVFDNALATWCKDKPNNARCISVYPTLLWPHEARGGKGKLSDNNPNRGGVEESRTLNIQRSAMMNIDKLLEGRTDFVDAFPEEKQGKIKPPKAD